MIAGHTLSSAAPRSAPAASISRIAGTAPATVVHRRVAGGLGVLPVAEPVVSAAGAGAFSVKAAAGAGGAEAGTVGEGRAGARSVAAVPALLHPFSHSLPQLRMVLHALPEPLPQPLAELLLLLQPLSKGFDPLADFPRVNVTPVEAILDSIPDVLAPVAHVLNPVAPAAVTTFIDAILGSVARILASVETILDAVSAVEPAASTSPAASRRHRVRRDRRHRQRRSQNWRPCLHLTSSK